MRVFVTLSNSLCLVDLDTSEISPILEGSALHYYYGITWDQNNFYVGRGVRGDEVKPVLLTLDSGLNIVNEKHLEGYGPHQLYYDNNTDKLHWCLAVSNFIYVGKENSWEEWNPLNDSYETWKNRVGWTLNKEEAKGIGRVASQQTQNKPMNFYNSIWIDNSNGNKYVVAHNRGNSEIIMLDNSHNIISITKAGRYAHNVWIDSNVIYTCSSKESSIIKSNGDVVYNTGTNHFVRGISIVNDKIALGMSEIASQVNRKNTKSILRILDRNWNLVKDIEFVVGTGQILDVRILSNEDICHNNITPPALA